MPPKPLAAAADDLLIRVEESVKTCTKGGHGFGMRKQGLQSDTWIARFSTGSPNKASHPNDCCPQTSRLVAPVHKRYDAGMTRSKIAISLPTDQLARVHREVRAGRADSVSGYITRVLSEHEKRESLRVLVRDLIAQHGEPAAKDIKWAERALAPPRG